MRGGLPQGVVPAVLMHLIGVSSVLCSARPETKMPPSRIAAAPLSPRGARQATCRVIKQPKAAYGREWLRRRAPPFFPG